MKTISVFCGAKDGFDPKIKQTAYQIGKEIAIHQIGIICGGTDSGLMQALTNGSLSEGGSVTGIFPLVLDDIESPHPMLSDLINTPCISTRKQRMVEHSDAFLVLPGGFGTLDEFFEVIVLKKLDVHNKPIILFNYQDFWGSLIKQINFMIDSGFIAPSDFSVFSIVNTIDELSEFLDKNF